MSYRNSTPPGMIAIFQNFPNSSEAVEGADYYINADGVKERCYYTERFGVWVSSEVRMLNFAQSGNASSTIRHHNVRLDANRGINFGDRKLFLVRWYASIRLATSTYVRLRAGNTTIDTGLFENSRTFHKVLGLEFPANENLWFDIGSAIRDPHIFLEYRWLYDTLEV